MEQTAQVEEQEVDEQGADEVAESETDVAELDETVQDAEKPTAPTPTEEEIRTRIQSEADRIAAKSAITYQQKLEEATKKIANMENQAARDKAESELRAREGRELEEWGDTTEVKEFHKERRDFNAWVAGVQTEYNKWQEEKKGVDKSVADAHALKLAIQYGMDNGEEIVKKLDSFVLEISEGKSEAERELKALRASIRRSKELPIHKPDSSRHSAPGAQDSNKLSGDDALEEGLKREKEKRR